MESPTALTGWAERKIRNPHPDALQTGSLLQAIVECANKEVSTVPEWNRMPEPAMFREEGTFATAHIYLGTLHRPSGKLKRSPPPEIRVTVTVDRAQPDVFIIRSPVGQAVDITGDRIRDAMNICKRLEKARRPRGRHTANLSFLVPFIRNPAYIERGTDRVYSLTGALMGDALPAGEVACLTALIKDAWTKTAGMSIQKPIALMLSFKFAVPLDEKIMTRFDEEEEQSYKAFHDHARHGEDSGTGDAGPQEGNISSSLAGSEEQSAAYWLGARTGSGYPTPDARVPHDPAPSPEQSSEPLIYQ
jgi:hypothetical protein